MNIEQTTMRFPRKLQEVQKKMDILAYSVTYAPDIYEPSIAYTNARTNTLAGDIYRIYVNDSDKELASYLYLHECGHIIFAHSRNMNQRMNSYLQAKLEAAYKKVAHLFPVQKKFFATFTQLLFNCVMDFEVNSRLFDRDEWDYMQEKTRLFLEDPKSSGMWPEDFDLPCGLTWNEYLNLILQTPEEFLTKYRFFISDAKYRCRQADAANNIPSLTQKEFEDYKKEYAEKKISKAELEKIAEEARDHNNARFCVPIGGEGQTKEHANPVNIDFIKYNSQKELLREIKALLHLRNTRKEKRDLLYNTNRRKLNSNVIVPKTLTEERLRAPKLYLLMDVSGSVQGDLVNDFISTFKEVSSFYSSTRFITWNTCLVADWKITDPDPHKYGGGTRLAGGIKYIRNKYKPGSHDILFVISDFYDNMSEWKKELQQCCCKSYAVNWRAGYNGERHIENPGFRKILTAQEAA